MPKESKKLALAKAKIDASKFYSLDQAIKLVQETSYSKFDGSIDLAFATNLDVRKSDQQLRGTVLLPHGTGKKIRILVTTDQQGDLAEKAGADIVVQSEEALVKILKSKKFDFDVIVTSPKMMPILGRFGKDLGPKGLMPNPKTGTVTPNVVQAVKDLKKGKANFRTDKNGVVHTLIGKVSMTTKQLIENAQIVIETIQKLKPSKFKGLYLKSLTISATMGPSVKIAD